MRRATLLLCLALTASGCWKWDEEFAARCADGGDLLCPQPDAGSDDGGANACRLAPRPARTNPCPTPVAPAPYWCQGTPVASGWCWNKPFPQGNELTAVWFEQQEVWFAGAGGTLGSFNPLMNSIGDRHEQLPSTRDVTHSGAVLSVAVSDDSMWAVVDYQLYSLLRSTPGRSFAAAGGAFATKTAHLVAARGPLVAIANNSGIIRSDGGEISYDGGTFTPTSLLLLQDGGCVATLVNDANEGWLFDCDGHLTHAPSGLFSSAQLDDGTVRLGGGAGKVLTPSDGGFDSVSAFSDDRTEDIVTLAPTPTGVLVGGRSGSFATSVGGVARSLGQAANAVSVSNGGIWLVGSGGWLRQFDAIADVVTPNPYGVTALHVDDAEQFAVGENFALRLGCGGEWASFGGDTMQPFNAVAAGDDGVTWLLDRNGASYTASPNITSSNFQLSAPLERELPRTGAAVSLSGNRVLLASGHTLAIGAPQKKAENLADLSDAGLDQISGIAVASCQAVAVGLQHPTDGGDPVQSAIISLDDGHRWASLPIDDVSAPLTDVTHCPDGRFVIAGAGLYEVLVTTATPKVTRQAPGQVFASVWCDDDNAVWALTPTGTVVVMKGLNLETQWTGLGPVNPTSNVSASSIRGNKSRVFIGAGNGALLSRPRP